MAEAASTDTADAARDKADEKTRDQAPDRARDQTDEKTRDKTHDGPPSGDADLPGAPPELADFAGIVERYETPLLRYLRRLAEPDEAEDLAQEAFLRLHSCLARGRDDGVRHVASWLFKVAHNLALDSRRRRRAHESAKERAASELGLGAAGERDEDESPEGLAAMIRRAACDKALEELGKLPAKQRRVLLLKVIQDFTMRQIAAITGTTPGNAAYHLNAGLTELSRRLKAAGVI